MRRSRAGLCRVCRYAEGCHVLGAGFASEVLGVAFDGIKERGGEPGPDFSLAGAQVFGEDRRGGPVGGSNVADPGFVAGAFRVMVHHGIHGLQAFGQIVAKDIGLDIHEDKTVHLFEFFGFHDEHVDPQGVYQSPVLGSLDFAKGDQGSGGPLSTQYGS